MANSAHPTGFTREQRLNVRVQQSRLAVYILAGLIGFASQTAGVLKVGYRTTLAVVLLAALSALVLIWIYRRNLGRRLGIRLEPAWMAVDVVLISYGVYVTGGAASPFFIWYLTSASAAAFVAGRRAAFAVGVASTLCYLGVLAFMGQIRGVDPTFWLATTRMGFLFGASFFFLRAVGRLQRKQRTIRRLQREQKQKVAELTALTQELDRRTVALAEANLRIREADRMKSQFLATMSHELRTPLNSIIGFAEILVDRLADLAQPKYIKFLNNIHASGQHLLGIINDILDLSKIEAGRMEVHSEEVSVPALVDGVLNVMHGMASKAHIDLEVDAPETLPAVETDPVKLKQILYNLLANALKFSPAGSTVRIAARVLSPAESPLGEESLTIAVSDEGIGIASADQETIFHEFRQADGTAGRAFGGTGLGLTLIRRFVELQGGRVSVQSELGVGSTFSVVLPMRARVAPPDARPAGETRTRPQAEHRVLIVDDDLLEYQSLSRLLLGAGYLPLRAGETDNPLELARSLKPVAIILDRHSFDIASALERHAETAQVPIVVLNHAESSADAGQRPGGRVASLVVKGRPAPGRLLAALRELDEEKRNEVARAR